MVRRRGMGGRVVVAALAAALAAATTAAPAHAERVFFEGEAMTSTSPAVAPADDPDASGGRMLALLNADWASRPVSTLAGARRVLLRVRGTSCGNPGSPQVQLALDSPGNVLWSWGVGTTSWTTLEAFVRVPPGAHTLYVRMAADLSQPASLLSPACDRNLYLDWAALEDMPPVFSPTSYRNAPLPDDAPLDPASDAFVAELVREYRATGATVNTTAYSAPVYTVPLQQRKTAVMVDLDPSRPLHPDTRDKLAEQWSAVPLPPGAQPAGPANGDNHLVVYQPGTDTLWEFWRFSYDLLGRPRAVYGGRIKNVSANPGHFQDPPDGPGRGFGATATSIPLLAGLQRIEELQAGSIDHVVCFHAPGYQAGYFRWPAQRTDAFDPRHVLPPVPLPEGIRFRLPADLDIDALGLPPYTAMLAKAVQRYGMVMDDSSSQVIFEAEDPGPTGTDPYTGADGIFGGRRPWGPDGLLASFPWDKLQALAETTGP